MIPQVVKTIRCNYQLVEILVEQLLMGALRCEFAEVVALI